MGTKDLGGPDDNNLEYMAYHPGSGGVAGIMLATSPLLSVRECILPLSVWVELAEDDPMLYKWGLKPVVQAALQGDSGVLNWALRGDLINHPGM